MILQDRLVVVEEGKLRVGLDVETICRPGVFHVMDSSRDQHGQYLQRGHPFLTTITVSITRHRSITHLSYHQAGAFDQTVDGLYHICCVC